MDWNEIPDDQCHLGDPSGASKTIFVPTVHLVQTVHLSCTDSSSVSKWIETRFHMTNVTEEIHQVRPKWFMSLWYVRRKLCTYLMSGLALYPNRPKRASTFASSPRSTIRCIQNDFWACGTFDANCASILRQDLRYLQTDQNKHPLEPRHLGVPSSASKMIFEPMVRSMQTVQQSRIKISTVSKQTKTCIHLSLVT
jgi:hypothetical protein